MVGADDAVPVGGKELRLDFPRVAAWVMSMPPRSPSPTGQLRPARWKRSPGGDRCRDRQILVLERRRRDDGQERHAVGHEHAGGLKRKQVLTGRTATFAPTIQTSVATTY